MQTIKSGLFLLFLWIGICPAQSDLSALADSIQHEIEVIRGEKFKRPVHVSNQSLEDFGQYLDRTIQEQLPEHLRKNYGKVVKKLGLYRGPEIQDFEAMIKTVMQSQAAAYYDPHTSTFYVVMQNLPAQALQSIYAHELYHGFQDQHYDLTEFMQNPSSQKLNDDELLARQAVVEGEATYIMTLWATKQMLGSVPDPALLQMPIKMQAEMSVEQITAMLADTTSPLAQSDDMKAAIKAMDDIPAFLLETLVGTYFKGIAFVFEIQQKGWTLVDSLYSHPPISTEQILHPTKWLENETPFEINLPAFKDNPLFHDWTLIEANTIGELQWRIIFAEYELADAGKTAAAGWNGDRFAVLQNDRTGDLLLLLYTSWDDENEAREFADLYRQLLEKKYPEGQESVSINRMNSDVLIVEGGAQSQAQQYLSFLENSEKTER